MKAEIMFKEYHNMKRELSILEYQLDQFKGINNEDLISAMCFSHPEGERVQNNSLSDKTSKVAISYRKVADSLNDDWFQFLWNKHEELREEIVFFEYSIQKLGDKLYPVIYEMVMEGTSWSVLMERYHVSHAMIGKYRQKAVSELNEIYSFRDRQLENYLLT